jgi:hypothetical protein
MTAHGNECCNLEDALNEMAAAFDSVPSGEFARNKHRRANSELDCSSYRTISRNDGDCHGCFGSSLSITRRRLRVLRDVSNGFEQQGFLY